MAFRLPRFNLICTVWRAYGPPFLPRPAGGTNVTCQLRVIRNSFSSVVAFGQNAGILILVPALTDIRPGFGFGQAGPGSDVIECPQLTGRFYTALFVDDIGKGFNNEHRIIQVQQQPLAVAFPIP